MALDTNGGQSLLYFKKVLGKSAFLTLRWGCDHRPPSNAPPLGGSLKISRFPNLYVNHFFQGMAMM